MASTKFFVVAIFHTRLDAGRFSFCNNLAGIHPDSPALRFYDQYQLSLQSVQQPSNDVVRSTSMSGWQAAKDAGGDAMPS
jgi:hypothetical protein